MLAEIKELEDLRAKKAALLATPATPRASIQAPTPKHPSPSSSQLTPSSADPPESEDDDEEARFSHH